MLGRLRVPNNSSTLIGFCLSVTTQVFREEEERKRGFLLLVSRPSNIAPYRPLPNYPCITQRHFDGQIRGVGRQTGFSGRNPDGVEIAREFGGGSCKAISVVLTRCDRAIARANLEFLLSL